MCTELLCCTDRGALLLTTLCRDSSNSGEGEAHAIIQHVPQTSALDIMSNIDLRCACICRLQERREQQRSTLSAQH